MRRIHVLLNLFLMLALAGVLGCGYTLKYTIATGLEPRADVPEWVKTFAVKNELKRGRAQFPMERKLLGILSQSLLDSGWSSALEGDAAFVFTVEFKRPYPLIYPEIGFTPYPPREYGTEADPKYYTGFNTDSFLIVITASAQGGERQYVWSAAIKAVSPMTTLPELARYTIPKAISRFPESGYWELKEKVLPRRKTGATG
jgi:hypothetical protein